MKHRLNCLDWKHPIRSIKNAYWRITKGFCPEDTWDWYTYMANLIHDSLYYLANNHCGTMYEYENKDLDYTDKLKEIADKILDATNYEDAYHNAFREDYYKDLEHIKTVQWTDKSGNKHNRFDFNETSKKLFENYIFIEEKNYKKAMIELRLAFSWIVEHWFELWD